MNSLKMKLFAASVALISLATPLKAQQGLWPNLPIVGGAAYCSSTTNGTCTNTVPAGPSTLTGNEQFPANTELSQGRSPQNVLVTPATLNALPIAVTDVSASAPSSAGISASSLSGGVLFVSGSTITLANVSLPLTPSDGQQYIISSSVTLTGLKVSVYPTSTATISNAPTVLTASTTAPFNYKFMYNSSGAKWYRLQ